MFKLAIALELSISETTSIHMFASMSAVLALHCEFSSTIELAALVCALVLGNAIWVLHHSPLAVLLVAVPLPRVVAQPTLSVMSVELDSIAVSYHVHFGFWLIMLSRFIGSDWHILQTVIDGFRSRMVVFLRYPSDLSVIYGAIWKLNAPEMRFVQSAEVQGWSRWGAWRTSI
jgi:hypothetical protein